MIEAIALIYYAVTACGATNTLAYWLATSLFAWILMGLFTRGRNEDLEELLRDGDKRLERVESDAREKRSLEGRVKALEESNARYRARLATSCRESGRRQGRASCPQTLSVDAPSSSVSGARAASRPSRPRAAGCGRMSRRGGVPSCLRCASAPPSSRKRRWRRGGN